MDGEITEADIDDAEVTDSEKQVSQAISVQIEAPREGAFLLVEAAM